MDTSLGGRGSIKTSCNHTCSSPAATTAPDLNNTYIWHKPNWFALSGSHRWNFAEDREDLPYHNSASEQTVVFSTKNRKSLLACSNFACSQMDQCSSTKRNFCVCVCVFVCFHPHFCELNLASTGDFKSVCSLFWRNGGRDVWFLRLGDDTLGSLLLHPVVSQWSRL